MDPPGPEQGGKEGPSEQDGKVKETDNPKEPDNQKEEGRRGSSSRKPSKSQSQSESAVFGQTQSPTDSLDEDSTKAAEAKSVVLTDSFYYDIENLICKPHKSDTSLPDDLLSLYHSFGYPCRIRKNLVALGDNRLLFISGAFLTVLRLKKSLCEYRYYPTTGGGSIGAVTLHPKGVFLAVAENGKQPDINIYNHHRDFALYRVLRKGSLALYSSVAFDSTGELLASQGGEPDFMLTVWNWRQEAIMLRCKSFSQEVFSVSFNPELQGQLTTAGSGHIKVWTMANTFTGLKLQGSLGRFGQTDLSDIEGYVEFPDGKVLSGSEWGNFLLWEEDLIKVQIGRTHGKPCHSGIIRHMLLVDGEIISAGADGFIRSWNLEQIDSIEGSEAGVLVELDPMNEVLVQSHAMLYYLTQPPSQPNQEEGTVSDRENSELTDGEKEDQYMWYCQDGRGSIWRADLSFSMASKAPVRLLHFHAGPIVACAVSPVTYLVVTLGEDGSLRLYDFLLRKLLAHKQFKAGGGCLSWVPVHIDASFASIIAGFQDGALRRVVIDRNRQGGTIHNLKLVDALKPHEKLVTSLAFSCNSESKGVRSYLATTSLDSSIFIFLVSGAERYEPWCFVVLPHIPRQVTWSSDLNTSDCMMIRCDDGFLIEMINPIKIDPTETLECQAPMLRIFQFHSVKSRFLHQEELEAQRQVEEALEAERREANKEKLRLKLETPSAQNLRLEEEHKAAEEMLWKRKHEEAEWEPYIPPNTSPITQVLYTEGKSKFWLTLDDYDNGFFYEYSLSAKFFPGVTNYPAYNVDVSKPLRQIRLEDSQNKTVTAMCCTGDGTCIFLGMKDGHIRLQFVETELDLGTPRLHYITAAHDVAHGAIRDMKLSHDEVFLLTVGEDGNFFVFTLVPPEQLADQVRVKNAVLPETLHLDDEAVKDLNPNEYTIEQNKQKSAHDGVLQHAELRKNIQRAEILELRNQFKKALTMNNSIPQQFRMKPTEFVMDPTRAEEMRKENAEKVTQVRKVAAFLSAKTDLGYKKLHDFYIKPQLGTYLQLRSIDGHYIIKSYRITDLPMPPINLQERTSVTQASSFKEPPEPKLSASVQELQQELKLLQETEHERFAHIPERTLITLRRCKEKKIKRVKRKLQWKSFLQTYPDDNYEVPGEAEKIQAARETIGVRLMKSDETRIRSDYKLNRVAGTVRLQTCEKRLQELMISFNQRLMELRDVKAATLKVMEKMVAELHELQTRIPKDKWMPAPYVPQLQDDESAEPRFERTAKVEQDVRESMKHKKEEQRRTSKLIGAASIRGFPGSRRESIIKAATSQKNDSKEKVVVKGPLSDLQMELEAIETIELLYRQESLIKQINETQEIFDLRFRQLRHDKLQVNVVAKLGELRLVTLNEEQLLIQDSEAVENELLGHIEHHTQAKEEVVRDSKRLTRKMAKITQTLDKYYLEEAAMLHKLDSLVGEHNRFRDFLFKVFKKKTKKTLERKATESADSSATSSEDESDDLESILDDEDGFPVDLGVCPPGCNQDIFDMVVVMREGRTELDEKILESKRTRDALNKELDACNKKKQLAVSVLSKSEKDLNLFQLDKQKRVNEFLVVVNMHLHRIQCLKGKENLEDVDDIICMEEKAVKGLQRRIRELQNENARMKEDKALRRAHHHQLMMERRQFMHRLRALSKECDVQMIKKFGVLVDLEILEQVPACAEVEEVRSRLFREMDINDAAIRQINREVEAFKSLRNLMIPLDSAYTFKMAEMKTRKNQLEVALDKCSTHLRVRYTDDKTAEREQERMLNVVAHQENLICCIKEEIVEMTGHREDLDVLNQSLCLPPHLSELAVKIRKRRQEILLDIQKRESGESSASESPR